MKIQILLLTAIAAFSGLALANETDKKPKRGFYWYEEPKEEVKEKYKKPTIPPVSQIMKMHPKDIEALLDEALDYAVYTQSEEDTKAYYVVYDAMRRKSSGFAGTAGYVLMKNPELNSGAAYATTNPSRNQAKKDEKTEIYDYLYKGKNDYALIMFTQKGCNACSIQRPMLQRYGQEFGWNIKEVDIADHPMAQAKYGINGTPITILVNREDMEKFLPIAIGVATDNELKANTYRGIRLLEGVIKPSQFYTRDRDIGKFFDPSAKDGSK